MYKGDTCLFKVGGRMVPFKVLEERGRRLTIRSLDLKYKTTIFKSRWDKQQDILEDER